MTIESPLKIETGPGRGAWAAPVRTFFSRLFKQDILGTVCAGLLAAIVVCTLAPWIAPLRLRRDRPYIADAGPSWSHHLGTDELRTRHPQPHHLWSSVFFVIVCITVALLSLALSGHARGSVRVFRRTSRCPGSAVRRYLAGFPDLIVLIAGVAVLGPGIVQIIALSASSTALPVRASYAARSCRRASSCTCRRAIPSAPVTGTLFSGTSCRRSPRPHRAFTPRAPAA